MVFPHATVPDIDFQGYLIENVNFKYSQVRFSESFLKCCQTRSGRGRTSLQFNPISCIMQKTGLNLDGIVYPAWLTAMLMRAATVGERVVMHFDLDD